MKTIIYSLQTNIKDYTLVSCNLSKYIESFILC